MSKPPDSERRFPSRYSETPETLILPHQWLAEYTVANQAAKEGVALGRAFWKFSRRWEKAFQHQSRAASALLRLVPLEAVGNILRTQQGKRVFSLAAQWFVDLCVEESRRLETKRAAEAALEAEKPAEPAVAVDDVALPAGRRPASTNKKGSLGQLEGL